MDIIDRITENGIKKYLKAPHDIIVYEDISSTNDELKKMAKNGAAEGTVVISDHQSGGKGRRGRSFFSPPDSGIYMSLLFRPDEKKPSDILKLTSYAAVAVSCAVTDVCGVKTGIKWVNDIYIGDKKICGILAEAVTDKSGTIGTVVAGIGINVYEPPVIPDEIKDIVGYIYPGIEHFQDESFDRNIKADQDGNINIRNMIIASVINNLYDHYYSSDDSAVMEQYRQDSIVLGRRVVYGADLEYTGVAVDIDSDGALIVEDPYGKKTVLKTGEISLRVI